MLVDIPAPRFAFGLCIPSPWMRRQIPPRRRHHPPTHHLGTSQIGATGWPTPETVGKAMTKYG